MGKTRHDWSGVNSAGDPCCLNCGEVPPDNISDEGLAEGTLGCRSRAVRERDEAKVLIENAKRDIEYYQGRYNEFEDRAREAEARVRELESELLDCGEAMDQLEGECAVWEARAKDKVVEAARRQINLDRPRSSLEGALEELTRVQKEGQR